MCRETGWVRCRFCGLRGLRLRFPHVLAARRNLNTQSALFSFSMGQAEPEYEEDPLCIFGGCSIFPQRRESQPEYAEHLSIKVRAAARSSSGLDLEYTERPFPYTL